MAVMSGVRGGAAGTALEDAVFAEDVADIAAGGQDFADVALAALDDALGVLDARCD